MSKRLGGIIGYKDKPLHSISSGSPMVVTSNQQYNVGENPTVVLYAYINRHAATPNKTKAKYTMSSDYSSICYIGSTIGWVSMKEIFKSWM